jgi:hypothetical protein
MSLAGAVMPFILAESFLVGVGSLAAESSQVRLLAGGYFALVGISLVYLAIMILVDEKHDRILGALTVTGNGIMALWVIGFYSGLWLSSSSIVSEGLILVGLLIGQALGVAGGLMSMMTRNRTKTG